MKTQTFFTTKDFALKSIIEKISDDENLVHYKNYCQKRLDGLRKEAFAELNVFLKDFWAHLLKRGGTLSTFF